MAGHPPTGILDQVNADSKSIHQIHCGGLLVWITVTALLLLAALPFVIAFFQPAPVATRAVRSFILPPEKSILNFIGLNAGPVTVSPDGRRLAFVASASEGRNLLWVRSLDALSAQQLAGTEGAFHPFWSPDNRFLEFFADGKLKKIDAAGGLPIALCEAPWGVVEPGTRTG